MIPKMICPTIITPSKPAPKTKRPPCYLPGDVVLSFFTRTENLTSDCFLVEWLDELDSFSITVRKNQQQSKCSGISNLQVTFQEDFSLKIRCGRDVDLGIHLIDKAFAKCLVLEM